MLFSDNLIFLSAITVNTSLIHVDDVSAALVHIAHRNDCSYSLLKWAIKQELTRTESEEILFRGQSVYIKVLSDFAALVGKQYLCDTLRPTITELLRETKSFEVREHRWLPCAASWLTVAHSTRFAPFRRFDSLPPIR